MRTIVPGILALMLMTATTLLAAGPDEVGGVIDTVPKSLGAKLSGKGVLFVIAKKAGAAPSGMPPLAVLRIPSPSFPQPFTLSSKNLIMQGTAFEGPLTVTARYSPSGDALDKSGPEGVDPSAATVQPGKGDLHIQLKTHHGG